jgi:hypothetical protein
VLLSAFLVSGCATIEGAPQRVIDESMSMGLIAKYPMNEAMTRFSYPDGEYYDWTYRDGLSRQQYRDMVVRLYMSAMDSRYNQFTTMLSSERRQADFGLDLAVLGFTGWASVAKASIVNNLSAVAAGFAGARGVVDKDLYFAKAVPALIAAMDADRIRAQARIEANLQKEPGDYPLVTAFAELARYEVASTLDGAARRLTSVASADLDEAIEELRLVETACQAEEGAIDVSQNIFDYLERYVPDDGDTAVNAGIKGLKLARIANAIGVKGGWTTSTELYLKIEDHVLAGKEGKCSQARLEEMFTKIKAEMKEDF